jgi:hypothetical protein
MKLSFRILKEMGWAKEDLLSKRESCSRQIPALTVKAVGQPDVSSAVTDSPIKTKGR